MNTPVRGIPLSSAVVICEYCREKIVGVKHTTGNGVVKFSPGQKADFVETGRCLGDVRSTLLTKAPLPILISLSCMTSLISAGKGATLWFERKSAQIIANLFGHEMMPFVI